MFEQDRLEPACSFADGLVHADLAGVTLAFVAQEGLGHSPGVGEWLGTGAALGAQAPEVGRVLLVTADLDHLIITHLHDDAAADTAVGAHAAHAGLGHGPLLLPGKQNLQKRQRRCVALRRNGATQRLCREINRLR